MSTPNELFDPLQPHSHEPNPAPPSADPTIEFVPVNGRSHFITIPDLQLLTAVSIPNCLIVSTGHGTTGPFTFTGVSLLEIVTHYCEEAWTEVEVVSGDGFGNRVTAMELYTPDPAGPILLAYQLDGQMLTREQGAIRMIVPSERDDALRQVKWIGKIKVVGQGKRP